MRFFLMLLIGFVSGIITSACGYSYFNPETMITAIIMNGAIIMGFGIIMFLILD